MDGTGSEIPPSTPPHREAAGIVADSQGQGRSDADGVPSLRDLVAQLEQDPDECLRAFHGLESIEEQTRLKIIEGLTTGARGPGVSSLLRLLACSHDRATRTAALIALGEPDGACVRAEEVLSADGPLVPHPGPIASDRTESGHAAAGAGPAVALPARQLVRADDLLRPRLVHSLVTAVDGAGRGSIALSAVHEDRRTTAVFLCDVDAGVIDAIGLTEAESAEAGGLILEAQAEAGGLGLEDAHELALALLAGSYLLNAEPPAAEVARWLERTLGRDFQPRPLPAPWAPGTSRPMSAEELLSRTGEILDACPTWLDGSRLTFELAEEIILREGRAAPDPVRDSGAFRFLFEHRVSHRLEPYRRMLLWMAWFWGAGGEHELARSAQVLARQLSDEQYAVPSHPFVVALTARSLAAAQAQLADAADARAANRGA